MVGRGVAGELAAAARVVPVDRVHQADHGHLGQVVDRLAAVAEAAGQALGEGDVVLDGLAAQVGPVGRVGRQRAAATAGRAR